MKNLLILLTLTAALAVSARAADLTAPDASFTWTNVNAWNSGTATWNSSVPDSALFNSIAADRTVTLTSAIDANNITFANAANRWTVSGSSGIVDLDGTITKNGAGSVTVSANTLLTGGGGISINAGEFRLANNAHTFGGGITLNGGTLYLPTGFANGTGAPQTAGVFGTGTFTINGGTIYFEQNNVRSQAVAAVIGGSFATTATVAGGGGVTLGTTDGTRTVSVGGASRTITVAQNADGTGANSFLAFQSLVNTAGGGIVKEGAGLLRIQGGGFNGAVTVNAGTVEISGTTGAASYVVNSGAFLRNTINNAITAGGSLSLNSGSLILNTTGVPGNTRNAQFATLQISGTSDIFVGSGLTIQSSGSIVSGINVRSGGILGGDGRLRTAATQGYSSGNSSLSDFTDSSITLSAGGKIKPGTPDSLDSTIGTLAFGNLTWNGEGSSIAQIAMNLGTGTNSDRISLSGALTKGTGSNFVFDFLGFNATSASTYTLMTFNSQSGFAVGNFSSTNISFGSGLSGEFRLNSDSLQFAVIPEPSTILAALGLTGVFLWPARRRLLGLVAKRTS